MQYRKPAQLVPRRDVHEVRERLAWDGSVVEPLNEDDLRAVTRYFGPAVIEEQSATTFVPPGYEFRLDDWGNLLIQKEV